MAVGFKWCYRNIKIINSFHRGIMTSHVNLEKAVEDLQKNPYYEKYADRIATLQKTSPEEFVQRIQQRDRSKQQPRPQGPEGPQTSQGKLPSVDTAQYSSVLNPKEPITSGAVRKEKQLGDILKIDLVKDKSASEIERLWCEYHKDKEVVVAAIPAPLYDEMWQCWEKYPTFLFPLPRSQGYEFIMCQRSGHELHFTPLLAFQVHGENAPECLTLVHYPELRACGVVLLRGEYDARVLSAAEAQCLAHQVQLYYGGAGGAAGGERRRLLHTFTHEPAAFRHTDLVAQLHNLTIT